MQADPGHVDVVDLSQSLADDAASLLASPRGWRWFAMEGDGDLSRCCTQTGVLPERPRLWCGLSIGLETTQSCGPNNLCLARRCFAPAVGSGGTAAATAVLRCGAVACRSEAGESTTAVSDTKSPSIFGDRALAVKTAARCEGEVA